MLFYTLINIRQQSPSLFVVPQWDLFQVPLWVFGSTCFIHDLSWGLHKPSAHVVKCVFSVTQRSRKSINVTPHLSQVLPIHVSLDTHIPLPDSPIICPLITYQRRLSTSIPVTANKGDFVQIQVIWIPIPHLNLFRIQMSSKVLAQSVILSHLSLVLPSHLTFPL